MHKMCASIRTCNLENNRSSTWDINPMSETSNLPSKCVLLPLLPLRDILVFPHMVVSLFVGRPKSIKALEFAMASGKRIMLTAQKNPAKDELKSSDLYPVGCI